MRLGRAILPAPLAASITFRLYLAERDLLVRQAARGVCKLRRLAKTARPEAAHHLKALQAEAKAFVQALKVGRKAALAMWQLTRDPHTSAAPMRPCWTRTIDGGRTLAGRFTLEFRAHAARPRTRLKRELTVPVDSANAKLCIAVRGVGQVALSHVTLTDGTSARRARLYQQAKILGKRAPARGFPAPDWETSQAGLIVSFG